MLVEVKEDLKTILDIEQLNYRYEEKQVRFSLVRDGQYGEDYPYTLITYYKDKEVMKNYTSNEAFAIAYAQGYMDSFLNDIRSE